MRCLAGDGIKRGETPACIIELKLLIGHPCLAGDGIKRGETPACVIELKLRIGHPRRCGKTSCTLCSPVSQTQLTKWSGVADVVSMGVDRAARRTASFTTAAWMANEQFEPVHRRSNSYVIISVLLMIV